VVIPICSFVLELNFQMLILISILVDENFLPILNHKVLGAVKVAIVIDKHLLQHLQSKWQWS
jgi:hypothetical protein